ncbi:MAG: hypothetical protein J5J00_09085 [Deltaproteobacteria bacterium]|nr:hypothetical protein [Deltaproteobacteria bacterium]
MMLLIAFSLPACTPRIPRDALMLQPESLALRQLQTRRFDTAKEKDLLQASAAVLQDLGFNIDESETELGVIVGSKSRDATDAGQVVGAVVFAIIFNTRVDVDKEQKIRASVVSAQHENSTSLRVTFQRIVWNTRNEISKTESIEDPEVYQEFLEKLSKSVFLEAHSI